MFIIFLRLKANWEYFEKLDSQRKIAEKPNSKIDKYPNWQINK